MNGIRAVMTRWLLPGVGFIILLGWGGSLPTRNIRQLTFNPSPEFGAFCPSLSADGTTVAFASTADLTGENPSHLPQLFVIQADGTGLQQLTQDEFALPPYFLNCPSLSGDGSLVAFLSKGDPLGENPQYLQQLFLIRTDGTGLKQLTHAVNGWVGDSYSYTGYSFSADGTTVVFIATADLTGENPDRNNELFVIKSDGTGLKQLTVSQGVPGQGNFRPSLSADGTRVAFDSNRDLTGENSDESSEIFFMHTDGTGLRQLTSSPYSPYDSVSPSLSGDGQWVAFGSRAELTGEPPDADSDIFLVNVDGTGLIKLTKTLKASDAQKGGPSLNAASTRLAYSLRPCSAWSAGLSRAR